MAYYATLHLLRLFSIITSMKHVPCAAHTLNLVGVHAASVSAMMVTFFGRPTVQAIFNFFSASTSFSFAATDDLRKYFTKRSLGYSLNL